MSKLLPLTILLAFIFTQANAQNAATPNPGFESWTQVSNYWDPNGWDNLNSATAILGVFTCTRASAAADVHSGTYAIKLTTKSVFGIKANGIASTATLITTPPYGITGGLPYADRPDSIVGWYKYNPASSADSGFVQFVLQGPANDTIGFVKFVTPNTAVGTYTRFSKPITYFSPATPSLSYWILSSSDGANPVVNSNIFVDDIDLVFNPGTGINENAVNEISLVSNLVGDFIQVRNLHGLTAAMELFDLSGRMARRFEINDDHSPVSAESLNAGIYFYRITQNGTGAVTTGKLVKY